MFGFLKKKNSTPWKTNDGQYKCQEDICPKGLCGSGKCPLDLQTQALEKASAGQTTEAISLLKKAINIAPDFAQLHCILGACYGDLDKHAEARDAFQQALVIEPDNPTARECLATAEKQLSLASEKTPSKKAEEIVLEILAYAAQKGDIKDKSFDFVPELLPYAKDIGQQILCNLRSTQQEHGIPTNPKDLLLVLEVTIFAGFGAVLEWNADWPTLLKTGLLPKLCEKRGFYAMDEYVISSFTGENYDPDNGIRPPKAQAFASQVQEYAYVTLAIFAKQNGLLEANIHAEHSTMLTELAKTAFYFGMTWALNKIMKN